MLRRSLVVSFVGGLGFVGYSMQDPESKLYSSVVIPGLNYLDAERAHNLSLFCASKGFTPVDQVVACTIYRVQFLPVTKG